MLKPWICDDCFEQCFALFHSVLEKNRHLAFGGVNLEYWWLQQQSKYSTLYVYKWLIINQSFHPHLVIRLEEDLIVFWQSHQKDDRRYVLEAVDPLSALRSLASHVDHSETLKSWFEFQVGRNNSIARTWKKISQIRDEFYLFLEWVTWIWSLRGRMGTL